MFALKFFGAFATAVSCTEEVSTIFYSSTHRDLDGHMVDEVKNDIKALANKDEIYAPACAWEPTKLTRSQLLIFATRNNVPKQVFHNALFAAKDKASDEAAKAMLIAALRELQEQGVQIDGLFTDADSSFSFTAEEEVIEDSVVPTIHDQQTDESNGMLIMCIAALLLVVAVAKMNSTINTKRQHVPHTRLSVLV